MNRILSCLLLTAATAVAQIPDGHVVACSLYYGGFQGGLWVFDPRLPVPPQPITGLPPELVGSNSIGFVHGANCVHILADGRLAVGEAEHDSSAPAELFLLTLNGLAVVGIERVPFGNGIYPTHASGADITEVRQLPDGDLLVSGSTSQGRLFHFDLDTHAVTPIVVSGISASTHLNSIELDQAAQNVYSTDPLNLVDVFQVPVGGGVAQPVGTVGMHSVTAKEHDGRLLFGVFAAPQRIERLDPTTGFVTTVGYTGGNINALAVEPATGTIAFVTNGYNGPARRVRLMDPVTGAYTELGTLPSGFPSGLDIASDPTVYGVGTSGNDSYGWYVGPGLGGLPRVGNAAFSVQATTTAAAAFAGAALFASPTAADVVFAGVRVLLDPAALVPLGLLPGSGQVSLPIPNVAALAGQRLHLQSAHLDAGAPAGVATSTGLRVTLLP